MRRLPSQIILTTLFILLTTSVSLAETIGVIITADNTYYQEIHEAFISNLSKKGYLNRLRFIVQKPYSDLISWRNAVRKLVAVDVDIILTYGSGATFAAIKEKTGIPIAYAAVYEPIGVKSKLRDATGVHCRLPVSSILRYIRSTATIKNLGVLYSSLEEDSAYQFEEIKSLSSKYDFTVIGLNLRKAADATALLSQAEVDALFLTSSAVLNTALPQVLSIARNKKLPTGSLLPCKDICALITLMADPKEQGQEVSEKLIKILDGNPAGNIPASCSQNTDLIFNMKEARDMNIRIPMELITEATRIIY